MSRRAHGFDFFHLQFSRNSVRFLSPTARVANGCSLSLTRAATRFPLRSGTQILAARFHAKPTPAVAAAQYGQPTWMTHPHLMEKGSVTPGLSAAEYEERRRKLMDRLPEKSIVISTSHRTQFMSQNIFYPFHQHTDFHYLCGFNEPDSALVLEKDSNSSRGYKMTMFVAPKNAHIEMWEGARNGLEAAKEIFGADEAMDSNLFRYRIFDMASRHNNIYFDDPTPAQFLSMDIAKKLSNTSGTTSPSFTTTSSSSSSSSINFFQSTTSVSDSSTRDIIQNALKHWFKPSNVESINDSNKVKEKNTSNTDDGSFSSSPLSSLSTSPSTASTSSSSPLPFSFTPSTASDIESAPSIKALSPLVQEQRAVKSEAEIKIMRQAGEISGKAFIETMKFTNRERTEQQVYAKFDFECRMRGSQMLAYVPVVAGGSNALTMHYVNNDQPLNDGDLLLMDAGGEYNAYASDITRTWPVNGKFTEAQRELYEVVLHANKECIKLCTEEHGLTLNQIHDVSMRLTKEGITRLGIRATPQEIERQLYPHHVGHYLGMDVHDTSDVSRSRPLKEGMVITIEPGLYIPKSAAYPKKYQGIGIRIEDNVVIGKTSPTVLSVTAPKEVVDIEFCCANK